MRLPLATTTRRALALATRRGAGAPAHQATSTNGYAGGGGANAPAFLHPRRSASATAATASSSGLSDISPRLTCLCGCGAARRQGTRSIAHVAAAAPPADLAATPTPTPSSPPAVEASREDADHRFMGLALDEARAAAAAGEVPVGAVLVRTRPPRLPPWEEEAGETSSSPFQPVVLAADRNRIEASHDATSHAELLVLRAAAAAASRPGGWRLGGTTLYVTVEPCPMCAGAALLARVDRVVWGAPNPGTGADGGWVGLLAAARAGAGAAEGGLDGGNGRPHRSHPGLEVTRGVRGAECAAVMVDFFRARRAAGAASKVEAVGKEAAVKEEAEAGAGEGACTMSG